MADPRAIAAIDIGKTNAKLVLFDAVTGHEIEILSTPNSVLPAPPYPHHDLDRLWRFVLDGLGQLHRHHGVDGISITTHGATACSDGRRSAGHAGTRLRVCRTGDTA